MDDPSTFDIFFGLFCILLFANLWVNGDPKKGDSAVVGEIKLGTPTIEKKSASQQRRETGGLAKFKG